MNDINYIEAIKNARAAGNKTLARDLTTQGVLLGLDGVMTTMNETMDIASPADTSMYDAKLNDMGLWRGRNYYDTDSVIQGYINQPQSFSVDADDLNPSGWQSAGKIATMAGQGALTGLQIGGMPGAIIGGAVSGLAGFFGDRYARNANKLNADILNSKADTEVDLNKIALRTAVDQAHDYQFGQAWSQRKYRGGRLNRFDDGGNADAGNSLAEDTTDKGNYYRRILKFATDNPGALWRDDANSAAAREWLRNNAPNDFRALYWAEPDDVRKGIDRRFLPEGVDADLYKQGVTDAINKNGVPLALATFGVPAGLIAGSELGVAVATNPLVKAAFDVVGSIDGIRNAASDNGVKKTVGLVNDGKYGRAVLSGIGDVFDITGGIGLVDDAYRYGKGVAKRGAEAVLRMGDAAANIPDLKRQFGDKATMNYVFNPFADSGLAYKLPFRYSGESAIQNEFSGAHFGDIVDQYLGKVDVPDATYDTSILPEYLQEYIAKNYPGKKIPIRDLGNAGDAWQEVFEKTPGGYISGDSVGILKDGVSVLDPGGFVSQVIERTPAGGGYDNVVLKNWDIWKFNDKDYISRHSSAVGPKDIARRLGLKFLDSQGVPIVHTWTSRGAYAVSPEVANAINSGFDQGGEIHIKKENEGKFTAAAKRRNMTVQEFAKHVLSEQNKDKYSATMRRRANFARNAAKWHDDGGQLDNSNMSSDFNTHGGFYSPGLMHIGAGGTHEQNPNGGVQLGVDVQGIPNLVEEGESVYKDYVFSDRLKPTAKELKDNSIPEKYAGKSFSEISKILSEEAEQRPNDAISAKGMGAMLDRLSICQEVHKQKKEAAELRRELASMSDEELAALGQALAASSVPEQVPVAQQGAPAMMPYPQAEGYVDPQFAAVPEEQAVMKCGGKLANKYDDGTRNKQVGPLLSGYVYADPNAYTGSFWKPAENNGEAAGYKEAMLPDSYTGYGTVKIPAPGTGMADTTVREDAPVARPRRRTSGINIPVIEAPVIEDVPVDVPVRMERLIEDPIAKIDSSWANKAYVADVNRRRNEAEAKASIDSHFRERAEENKDAGLLPTGLRYAGAASNLLTGLYNLFQQPDKVDWGYVQPQYVNGRMALQRAQYDPLDVQAAVNQVVAQNNATARQIANSGLGPSTGAALIAANANAGRNMGSALSAATLANAQQRNAVLAQNNAAEQAESEFYKGLNATNADIYNRTAQYNKQLAMDQALRNIQFENEKYAAVSNALNAAATDLANIGRENFIFNQVNTNDALFYGTGIDGSSYYKASDGSYFKVDRMTGNKVPVTADEALRTRTRCNGGLLKKFNG